MDSLNVTFKADGFELSYSIVSERGCVGMAYFIYGLDGSNPAGDGEFYSIDDAIQVCRMDFQVTFEARQAAEVAETEEDDDEEEDDDCYDDDMDGDHESALASAGYGTDEDYGCYGGDEGW